MINQAREQNATAPRIPRGESAFVDPYADMINQAREQNATAAVSASSDPIADFREDFGMEYSDPNTISPADVQKAEDTNKLDALRTIREIDEKTGVPTEPTTPAGGGTGGTGGTSGGGGGGGGGGAGGVSSYEQQLMDALASREKAATQDKWLALAQVGLNMMSSTNPTLLGAVGEAGLKGVEAARSARDQYDKDKLELQGAIEQSRMARAAAAARSAGGAGRKAIPEGVLDIYDTEIEALSAAASDPTTEPAQKLEAAKRLEGVIARRDQLVNIYFSQFGIDTSGASPATSSGVVFEDVPS
jgi:hypothetical protein